MINTAEFWILVSFIISLGVATKFILPKLKAGLFAYQHSIERLFLDAESMLLSSEKKFAVAKESFDSLSEVIAQINIEFEARVSHKLHEWTVQHATISEKYKQLQEHKLQHLQNHVASHVCENVASACLGLLQFYLKKHVNSKVHQGIVMQSLQNLPRA